MPPKQEIYTDHSNIYQYWSNSFLSKLHQSESNDAPTSKWARHTLSFPKTETSNTTPQPPVRKSRTSRFANKSQ